MQYKNNRTWLITALMAVMMILAACGQGFSGPGTGAQPTRPPASASPSEPTYTVVPPTRTPTAVPPTATTPPAGDGFNVDKCPGESGGVGLDRDQSIKDRQCRYPVPATYTVVPPTATPTAVPPTATPTPQQGGSGSGAAQDCSFPTPGNVDDMPKTKIELFQLNTWTHRVFNEREFHAPDWGGADSWFVTLNVGPNAGGAWTSYGNPGEVIYRASQNHSEWCLGVFTTSQWKSQFLAGAKDQPVAINVKIMPNSMVTVRTASGEVVTQATSDGGDITIILPDDGVVTIAVSFDAAAKTFESRVHWGPYDRSDEINTIDARK